MRAEEDAGHHGGQRRDRFDRQIHWPAMMTMSDRPIAMTPTKVDCSMMLSEDADLEEVRDRQREDGEHDDQHEPDEIVENELDGASPAGVIMPQTPDRVSRAARRPGSESF